MIVHLYDFAFQYFGRKYRNCTFMAGLAQARLVVIFKLWIFSVRVREEMADTAFAAGPNMDFVEAVTITKLMAALSIWNN
jgi:hypothetical protein